MSTPANLFKKMGTGPDGKKREYSEAWFSPVASDREDYLMVKFLNTLPGSEVDILLEQVSSIFCVPAYFRNTNDDNVFTSNSERTSIAKIVYSKPVAERAQFVKDATSIIPPGFAGSNRLMIVKDLARIPDEKTRSEFVEQARAMMEMSLLGIKTDRAISANTWATPFLNFFKYFEKYGKTVYGVSNKAKTNLKEFSQEQAELLSALKSSPYVSRENKNPAISASATITQEAKEASEKALTRHVSSLCHIKTDEHDKKLIAEAVSARPEKEREQFVKDALALYPKGLHGCNQSVIVDTLAKTNNAEECAALAKQARVVMEVLFLDLDPENTPHLWEALFSKFYSCSDEQRTAITASAQASLGKLKALQKEVQEAFESDRAFILAMPELKARYLEAVAREMQASSTLTSFEQSKNNQSAAGTAPKSTKPDGP